MYFFYIFLIIFVSLVGFFFLFRSMLTIFSFFTTSPFVPLEKFLIEKGLSFLNVGKGDRFLDIGCGDGRVVFSCAKKYPGAKFYKGIEIIRILVIFANVRRFFFRNEKKERIIFERENAKYYDYGDYNKIFMYLLPEFVSDLMKKLEKEVPTGAVIVSVAFAIPEKYKRSGELKVEEVKLGRKKKKIYIWKKN